MLTVCRVTALFGFSYHLLKNGIGYKSNRSNMRHEVMGTYSNNKDFLCAVSDDMNRELDEGKEKDHGV